jgi:hypothetical protein
MSQRPRPTSPVRAQTIERSRLLAVAGGQADPPGSAKAIGLAARRQSLADSCSGYAWLGQGAVANCVWRNSSKAVDDGVAAMANAGFPQSAFDKFGNPRARGAR